MPLPAYGFAAFAAAKSGATAVSLSFQVEDGAGNVVVSGTNSYSVAFKHSWGPNIGPVATGYKVRSWIGDPVTPTEWYIGVESPPL
jgi:hypothetical protein